MKRTLALAALCLSLGSATTFAQVSAVPSAMNFQGRLATPDGNPVPDGTYSILFSLYDALTGGTLKYSKTISNVAVRNGTFALTLDTFPAGTFNGNLWLEIQIGTDAPLAPRTPLVSVPYAMKSDLALTVPDGSITAAKLASGVLSFSNISGTIALSQIANGSITGDKIANNAITNTQLSSSLQQLLAPLSTFDFKPLTFRGSAATGIYPEAVDASGKYAYVLNFQTPPSNSRLQIFDVSNPDAPVLTGQVDAGWWRGVGVAVSGNYAYGVSDSFDTMQVFNVSNPANPIRISSITVGSDATAVTVSGNYAYVTLFNGQQMKIVDVSNPAAPVLRSSLALSTPLVGVKVVGNYAYVLGSNQLFVCDVHDAAAPVLTGSVSSGNFASGIDIVGKYAYVTVSSNTLRVYDISTPATPTLVGSAATAANPLSISVSGQYAYVGYGNSGGLNVYDIKSPTAPAVLGYASSGYVLSLKAANGFVYVVNENGAKLEVYQGPTLGLSASLRFGDGTLQTTSFQGAAAGGDLTGTYPNPLIALNAVTNTKLATDAASLSKVSGGAMTVSGSNIGIGNASPSNPLVVTGTGGSGSSLSNGVHLGNDTAGNAHIELVSNGKTPYIDFNNDNISDNKARIILQDNGTRLNFIATNIRVTGNFENLSDVRYKTKIAPLDNALEDILHLRGVSYDWDRAKWSGNHFAEGRQIGFIAQEVEKVFPELVKTDEKGYKSVNYIGVIPALVEAVKAQQKQHEADRAEITELKTMLKLLAERVNALEAEQHRQK